MLEKYYQSEDKDNITCTCSYQIVTAVQFHPENNIRKMTYQHKHPPFPSQQPHAKECNSSYLLNLGQHHAGAVISQLPHDQRNKHYEEESSRLKQINAQQLNLHVQPYCT